MTIVGVEKDCSEADRVVSAKSGCIVGEVVAWVTSVAVRTLVGFCFLDGLEDSDGRSLIYQKRRNRREYARFWLVTWFECDASAD
jgi:hypothetical protein